MTEEHTVERRRGGRRPDHPMHRYLCAWARYVARENRANVLGYAQSSYTEMVGQGSYRSDGLPVDPDVLRMDEIIKHRIPRLCVTALWQHYVLPGESKTKYEPGQSTLYYARLNLAQDAVKEQWELATAV